MKAKKKLAELKYSEDNDSDSDDEDDNLDNDDQAANAISSKSPMRRANIGLLALKAASKFSANR